MNRREAIAKATVDTTVVGTGLLTPEQSRAFIWRIKENNVLLNKMRLVRRASSSGKIDKASTASRIIRAATENADDGYRAGAAFSEIGYQTTKIRLPWEVTEDAFHENIEGEALEADLTSQMTTQFGLDLEDLYVNGDTAAGVGPDQAFLQINDGVLKQLAVANVAGRNIDGSTINAGVIKKDHFFEAEYAMPNRYKSSGRLSWIMSPNRATSWWEQLTNRTTAAGDSALAGRGGDGAPGDAAIRGPLGRPILEVPSFPDSTILLGDPAQFVQVVSWDIRKRRVTGETDATLAARDKRFYVFFIKPDVIIEEVDAVVRVHSLAAV